MLAALPRDNVDVVSYPAASPLEVRVGVNEVESNSVRIGGDGGMGMGMNLILMLMEPESQNSPPTKMTIARLTFWQ